MLQGPWWVQQYDCPNLLAPRLACLSRYHQGADALPMMERTPWSDFLWGRTGFICPCLSEIVTPSRPCTLSGDHRRRAGGWADGCVSVLSAVRHATVPMRWWFCFSTWPARRCAFEHWGDVPTRWTWRPVTGHCAIILQRRPFCCTGSWIDHMLFHVPARTFRCQATADLTVRRCVGTNPFIYGAV